MVVNPRDAIVDQNGPCMKQLKNLSVSLDLIFFLNIQIMALEMPQIHKILQQTKLLPDSVLKLNKSIQWWNNN